MQQPPIAAAGPKQSVTAQKNPAPGYASHHDAIRAASPRGRAVARRVLALQNSFWGPCGQWSVRCRCSEWQGIQQKTASPYSESDRPLQPAADRTIATRRRVTPSSLSAPAFRVRRFQSFRATRRVVPDDAAPAVAAAAHSRSNVLTCCARTLVKLTNTVVN